MGVNKTTYTPKRRGWRTAQPPKPVTVRWVEPKAKQQQTRRKVN